MISYIFTIDETEIQRADITCHIHITIIVVEVVFK